MIGDARKVTKKEINQSQVGSNISSQSRMIVRQKWYFNGQLYRCEGANHRQRKPSQL